MITTAASAVSSAATVVQHHLQRHTYNPRNFHELYKVPFTEYENIFECDLGINRIRKAVTSLTALLEVVSKGPCGAISRCLSQTVKSTAYTENMYIAYLLSLVACQLNGLDYQCEAEVILQPKSDVTGVSAGGNNPLLADSMEWLAFSLYRQGNYKEALRLCKSALVLLQTSLGMYHPHTDNCCHNLAVVLESRGIRRQPEDVQQKSKILISAAPQSFYMATVDPNKEFMGVSKPAAAVYQNHTGYMMGGGLQGLSVS